MRTYWAFYWPLALTGVGMVLSLQFQNATLARYPEAVTELAILALSLGIFSFFNASQQFIAQLSNVYARSEQGSRRAWRFVVAASLVITAPLLLLAIVPQGAQLISIIFSIDTDLVTRVTEYLLLLCPLIVLNGQRHYFTGLLAQARLTGWITIFNFIYLATVIAALIVGFALGGRAVLVVVGAEMFSVCLLLSLLLFAYRSLYTLPEVSEHKRRQLSRAGGLLYSSIHHRRHVRLVATHTVRLCCPGTRWTVNHRGAACGLRLQHDFSTSRESIQALFYYLWVY
jgi:hypothetical protein